MMRKTLLTGKNILVVDDEELLCEVFKEMFEYHGASVKTSNSGSAAFELLKKEKFDIVVSDVRMPKGDGMTLVRQISAELPYKPYVFLCTGFSDVSLDDAKKLGVLEIFSKPFSEAEILARIEKSLVSQSHEAA